VVDGDDFVVNGQKTWTTLAQDATHIFLLVRTDKNAKKQEGISFLLADMKTPGITVRPVRNIAGNEDFCEVFFDNVRVPRSQRVGELNKRLDDRQGAAQLRTHLPRQPEAERSTPWSACAKLPELLGMFDDPVFVDRYTKLRLDVADLGTLYSRYIEKVKRGEPLGPDVSMLKVFATDTFSNLADLLVESRRLPAAAQRATSMSRAACIDVLTTWFNARPATIYGGSNEIQRNILATHVLQLPA
jgi:alkylation response protein AidB-like acyl-CoA dehydrogenase